VRRILVIASERREFAGLLKRLGRPVKLKWGLGFACETVWRGNRYCLVASGAGQRLADFAAMVAGTRHKFDAIVSTGSCGGLDPTLTAGEIFVANEILAMDNGRRYPCYVPVCGRPYASGLLVSTDSVVTSVLEKRRLHALGARVVEMETSAIAAWALKWGVPLFCVRAVADQADEELLLDYNAARNGQGGLSVARILVQAVRNPLGMAPELCTMYRRSRRVAQAIGDFLAECQF